MLISNAYNVNAYASDSCTGSTSWETCIATGTGVELKDKRDCGMPWIVNFCGKKISGQGKFTAAATI